QYSFEAEYAARRAHEAYAKARSEAAAAPPAPPPHRASPVEGRMNLPSTSHAVLQPVRGTPVLQPSRPTDTGSSLPSVSSTSSLASSAAGAAATVHQENFEDFEGGATIFDELHMKSIDDRSALNEIWGAVQVLPNSTVSFNAAAAAAPVPTPRTTAAAVAAAPPPAAAPTRAAPVPPYPVTPAAVATAKAAQPARQLAPKPSTGVNGLPTPNGNVAAAAKPTATSPPTLNDSRAAIAAKLTTKGFRSHVVQLALATLTHEQLPYVEYYIKATSNLEKLKLPADRGLAFLVECRLTEKQDILRHAEVVTQLAGMGFPIEKCLAAARETKADRVKALDICLAA
ncbi:hypothetical protein PENTCL1PPCAC_6087, partial [Pristionchus entomophagus]